MKLSDAEKDQYAEENIRLVHYFAKKYHHPSREYDDTFGAAQLGMVKALNTFDTGKGVKFATYAGRCITNQIFMLIRKEKNQIPTISIDQPVHEDGEGNQLTLMDTLAAPEKELDWREISPVVNAVLSKLSGRKRQIMDLFFEDVTHHDIAKVVGWSQSYVSRIIGSVLEKIKSEYWKGEKKVALLTFEKYQEYKSDGLKDSTIAEIVGTSRQYINQLKKKWNMSSEQADTDAKQPDTAVEMETLPKIQPSEKESKSAEYERLIAALRSDLNDINTQLDEKDELIRNLESTIAKYVNGNVIMPSEDVENELDGLQDDNNCLRHALSQMQDENAILEIENNALKQLVKLWI